jgi:hypothetical protein
MDNFSGHFDFPFIPSMASIAVVSGHQYAIRSPYQGKKNAAPFLASRESAAGGH